MLRALGIHYFQGYLFAKPAFEQLPAIHWPEDTKLSRTRWRQR